MKTHNFYNIQYMGEAAKPIEMTVEQYLDFEAKSAIKHEYIDGYLRAFAGASRKHNIITSNLSTFLGKRVQQKGCYMFSGDMKLKISNNKFYYPDFMITCSPSNHDFYEENPCFLVEVLSNSTKENDYGSKSEHYLEIESLQRYVLINQTERKIGVFQRRSSGWHYDVLKDTGQIDIPCLKYKITLDQIYNRLNFS